MLNKFYLKLFLSILLFSFSAGAAEISVTNVGDPDNTTGGCAKGGNCSIRQAINAAAPGDTIIFNLPAASCPGGVCTVNLLLGTLTVNKNLTISGTGARNLIIRRGDGTNPADFTMFAITSMEPITVNINGISVAEGSSIGGVGGININGQIQILLDGVSVRNCGGAGIANNGGNLTLLNSTISNNVGFVGGIVNISGTVSIANSTISTNHGTGTGAAGGIMNGFNGSSPTTLNLNNVTITDNTETANDLANTGGVKNSGTAVNARNTIIAENSSLSSISQDISGTFISQGSNLVKNLSGSAGFGGSGDIIGQPAGTAGLGNYGGQTDTQGFFTMPPFPASPAHNAGNSCVVTAACAVNNPPVPLLFDQRGAPFTRNSYSTVDIGAYEAQPVPVPAAEGTIRGRVFARSGDGLGKVRVILSGAGGPAQTAITNPFGYFQFENIPTGQMITLTVSSKSFQYLPQIITVANPTDDLNFIPQ